MCPTELVIGFSLQGNDILYAIRIEAASNAQLDKVEATLKALLQHTTRHGGSNSQPNLFMNQRQPSKLEMLKLTFLDFMGKLCSSGFLK